MNLSETMTADTELGIYRTMVRIRVFDYRPELHQFPAHWYRGCEV